MRWAAAMTEAPLLELRGIRKSFGAAPVLNDLSFVIGAGERRGLIGPNGAGKTTLINVITGKHQPDAGQILYRGQDITALPPHRRNRLGIGRSFQILSLFNEATVRREHCRRASCAGAASAPIRSGDLPR